MYDVVLYFKKINVIMQLSRYQLQSYTLFTRSKNYLDRYLDRNLDTNLDCDPEDAPIYTGDSLFNTTKCITLLFIV